MPNISRTISIEMKYRKSQTWQMLLYSLVMRVRKNSHQGILLRTWILGKHIGGHSHCRDTEAPGLPCGKSHLHPRPFSGGLQHTFSWSQLPHLEPAGRYCFALTYTKCISKNDGNWAILLLTPPGSEPDSFWFPSLPTGTIYAAQQPW